VSNQFAVVCLASVFVLIACLNARSLLVERSPEMTTSVALIVTFVLGVLVGHGHLFTPVASAILMTMLLAWTSELQRCAGGLTPSKIGVLYCSVLSASSSIRFCPTAPSTTGTCTIPVSRGPS
jgi:uncharacterized membrane protein (DUF4010 family)